MSDYWYQQRYDDAVWAQRVEKGCCGNCGAFDGPTHRCPPRRPAERPVVNISGQPDHWWDMARRGLMGGKR